MHIDSRSPSDQDLTALSSRMINKKYFHNFLDKQSRRKQLIGPDGKFNENAFECIHDQRQFNQAVKSKSQLAKELQVRRDRSNFRT